jgi:hypothetical protein
LRGLRHLHACACMPWMARVIRRKETQQHQSTHGDTRGPPLAQANAVVVRRCTTIVPKDVAPLTAARAWAFAHGLTERSAHEFCAAHKVWAAQTNAPSMSAAGGAGFRRGVTHGSQRTAQRNATGGTHEARCEKQDQQGSISGTRASSCRMARPCAARGVAILERRAALRRRRCAGGSLAKKRYASCSSFMARQCP